MDILLPDTFTMTYHGSLIDVWHDACPGYYRLQWVGERGSDPFTVSTIISALKEKGSLINGMTIEEWSNFYDPAKTEDEQYDIHNLL